MAPYKIKLLGSPTAENVIGDKGLGLNNSGVAVGVCHIPEARGVIWMPGPVKLPVLGLNSVAFAVNDSGQVVGAWGSNPLPEGTEIDPITGSAGQAFLYEGNVMSDLASVFGTQVSVATDINNDGLIAAWAGDVGSPHAFLYNSQAGSVPQDLGVLPGHESSQAMALNNKGNVVGISKKKVGPDNPHGFFYDGGLIDLGPKTYAYDINDQGQIVGERLVSAPGNWSAFLCETSTGNLQFTDIGPLQKPGFVGSMARGINNYGDIIGASFNFTGVGLNSSPKMSHAFLRPGLDGGPGGLQAGEMFDLNDLIPANSGWLLHWALAINDFKQIVGVGAYNGQYRAYLLTPESAFGLDEIYEVAIDPRALILGHDLYVKLNLPRPVPVLIDALIDQIRKETQSMGPGEKGLVIARVKALSAFARTLEQELSKI
ncbi:MAG TPA: hypothetical protein VKB46_04895 [Pyrinomonadaceae bacterium]|nr:hypothetical protein [Pyrinomonadaceae bacterium]